MDRVTLLPEKTETPIKTVPNKLIEIFKFKITLRIFNIDKNYFIKEQTRWNVEEKYGDNL
ncbi:MAG: hypothetical protein MUO82_02430 [Candidatus Thermoplasmatota archaeon]|nr:hypothetical protein [Candidatus Thermoplasmatota archaeon]